MRRTVYYCTYNGEEDGVLKGRPFDEELCGPPGHWDPNLQTFTSATVCGQSAYKTADQKLSFLEGLQYAAEVFRVGDI